MFFFLHEIHVSFRCQIISLFFFYDTQKTNVLNKQKEDDEDDSNEYGDVNEKNHEGDHFLDQIDQNALRIFPLLFITFNVAYWSLCIFIIGDMSTSCE